jgi:hypothetical protein
LFGLLLFLLGPALVVLQFRLHHLGMIWYVPGLATLGVLLMILSVRQRPGRWRTVGLGLAAVLCGLEWYVLAVETRTPAYTGPAKPEHELPVFSTTLADGKEFTNNDLKDKDGKRTVLVFFRGRW